MEIGLFVNANGLNIPANVNTVTTTGYAAQGVGPGRYTYLPSRSLEDQAGSRFTAADGRVFGVDAEHEVKIEDVSSQLSSNVTNALQSAYNALDFAGRTNAPRLLGRGVGTVSLPRGQFPLASTYQPYSANGSAVEGEGRYVSAIISQLGQGGTALSFQGYNGIKLQDFTLTADNATVRAAGTVGLRLNGTDGGGHLTISRVDITDFDTCIRNEANSKGNGDKTLVVQSELNGNVSYDMTTNRQAIGWTFLNCAGSAVTSRYRLGGAGMNVVINDVADLQGSYISYPEGSGNPGADNWTGGTLVLGTKLEQHYKGTAADQNLLVDASASKLNTGAGGSNTDLTLLDVHVTAGADVVPDPDNTPIIVVGEQYDNNKGSDAIRVKAWGGWIRGTIRLCSQFLGVQSRRWSFERMTRAPLPSKVKFQGQGFHNLLEWRANENVPVDQYRGGQSFIGSVDAEKAFMWHENGQPNELMRSSIATFSGGTGAIPAGQTRYGQAAAVGGFPVKCSFTGLGVFIEANASAADILVEWFADANTTQLVGSMTVPSGHLGLRRMRASEVAGALPVGTTAYVRMSTAATNQVVYGAMVLFYFPFMGAS